MSGAELAAEIAKRLRAAGDPKRAAAEKRYMKSARDHWGVGAPKMDAILAGIVAGIDEKTLRDAAARLWKQEASWDSMIAGGRLLALRQVPASTALWRQIRTAMKSVDGWALADQLAQAARKCLLAYPSRLDELEDWLDHRDLWHRRACLVFTLPWSKRGLDPTRSLEWAARLVDDDEWFIQKAIGWWLRELGKHDPARVRAFLAACGARLKPFARREATKRLGTKLAR